MTERLKNLSRQVAGRIRSMQGRSRLIAAMLAFLVLLGTVWLVVAGRSQSMTALDTPSLGADDLSAAVSTLESHGIAVRVEAGRLLVRADDSAAAMSALRDDGLLDDQRRSAFEEITQQTDIWSTQATIERRWHVAKMATLEQLIADFPAVQSATVILEPGSGRSLSGDQPRAAVNVRLAEDAIMTGDLVDAIADLLAGSVSGMDPEDVRVVDSSGRSHVAGRDEPTDAVERLRRAEAHYQERIGSALRYIEGVIVSVDVRVDGDKISCQGAAVSLPRSHLSAHKADNADAELERIRLSVARTIGTEPDAVHVDWYRDARAAGRDEPPAGYWRGALTTGLAVVLILGFGVALMRKRKPAEPGQATDEAGVVTEQPDAATTEPFAFLADTPIEELQAALRGEHPQTVAVVLSYLTPARSAAALAALEPDRRVEVVRRIAALEQVDPQIISDVEESLRMRMSRGGAGRGGGVSSAASILRHVGGAAEQAVLDALDGESPDLARSIQRELMAFDDLDRLPLEQWSEALESLDSEDLAVALRTANSRLRRRFLSSVSSTTSKRIREQMDRIGPVRLSDVEAAQQRVVEAVRRSEPGSYTVEKVSQPTGEGSEVELREPSEALEQS